MSVVLAAAKEGGFNPFRVSDLSLFIWVLIAFVVVLYMLAKRIFPKLQETLAEREQRIKEDLEKAERTRQEAERILEDYKTRVNQAREESSRIIDDARQSAETVRRDLITRAEAEGRSIVEKTQRDLEGERERAVSELQQQLAKWSADIAGRIVQKELDPEAHRDLVESFIRDVGGATRSEGPAEGPKPASVSQEENGAGG